MRFRKKVQKLLWKGVKMGISSKILNVISWPLQFLATILWLLLKELGLIEIEENENED